MGFKKRIRLEKRGKEEVEGYGGEMSKMSFQKERFAVDGKIVGSGHVEDKAGFNLARGRKEGQEIRIKNGRWRNNASHTYRSFEEAEPCWPTPLKRVVTLGRVRS